MRAQRVYDPGFLGQTDKLRRLDPHAIVLPARERLERDGLAGVRVDNRLVHRRQRLRRDGASQLVFEPHTALHACVQIFGGEAKLVAGGAFRLIHGRVGEAQQIRAGRGIVGVNRNPDTRTDHDFMTADVDGSRDDFEKPPRDNVRAVRTRKVLQHDGELVTTEARHHRRTRRGQLQGKIRAAQILAQLLADRMQQPIARGMAERVVHMFETVEIDEHERNPGIPSRGRVENRGEATLERVPVRQSGDDVVVGELLDASAREFTAADVRELQRYVVEQSARTLIDHNVAAREKLDHGVDLAVNNNRPYEHGPDPDRLAGVRARIPAEVGAEHLAATLGDDLRQKFPPARAGFVGAKEQRRIDGIHVRGFERGGYDGAVVVADPQVCGFPAERFAQDIHAVLHRDIERHTFVRRGRGVREYLGIDRFVFGFVQGAIQLCFEQPLARDPGGDEDAGDEHERDEKTQRHERLRLRVDDGVRWHAETRREVETDGGQTVREHPEPGLDGPDDDRRRDRDDHEPGYRGALESAELPAGDNHEPVQIRATDTADERRAPGRPVQWIQCAEHGGREKMQVGERR